MLLLVVPLAIVAAAVLAGAALDAERVDARRRWILWAIAAPTFFLAWGATSLVREWIYERVVVAPAPVAWFVVVGAAVLVALAILAPRLFRPHPTWLVAALAPVALAWASVRVPVLLVPTLAGAAAVWPRAALAGLVRGGFGSVLAGVVAVVLVIGSAPSAFALLADANDGSAGSFARHAWSVDVAPAGSGSYTLTVPFLEAGDASSRAALAALAASLRVADGAGTARLAEDARAVEIRGEGPLRVLAQVEFQGSAGAREAFTRYLVADAPATLAGATAVSATWSLDMTGGGATSCIASLEIGLSVAPGSPEELRVGPDRRVPAACV